MRSETLQKIGIDTTVQTILPLVYYVTWNVYSEVASPWSNDQKDQPKENELDKEKLEAHHCEYRRRFWNSHTVPATSLKKSLEELVEKKCQGKKCEHEFDTKEKIMVKYLWFQLWPDLVSLARHLSGLSNNSSHTGDLQEPWFYKLLKYKLMLHYCVFHHHVNFHKSFPTNNAQSYLCIFHITGKQNFLYTTQIWLWWWALQFYETLLMCTLSTRFKT